MTFPPTWDRPHQKWDEPTLADLQQANQELAAALSRFVNRQVALRDRYRCRVCERPADPTVPNRLKRGHHHHIVFRSACGPETTANKVLLCRACHDAIHVKRTLQIDGNADEAPWLTLWKDEGSGWFVWKQEVGLREYEKD
jgi:hypothetical protein